MELIGERMTHFVKADEEHVADDEVSLVARILAGSFDRLLVIGSRALMLGHGNGAGKRAEDDRQSGEGLHEHGERPVFFILSDERRRVARAPRRPGSIAERIRQTEVTSPSY